MDLQNNSEFQSFQFFMDWSSKLQFTDGFADLYRMVLEAIQEQSPYNNAWIYITNPENKDETYLISMVGDKGDVVLEDFNCLNMVKCNMLREITTSHRPVVVEDARIDPRTNKDIVNAIGSITIINVPVVLTGELVGMFGAGTFGDEGVSIPSKETLALFDLLSNYIAPVIVRIHENNKREKYTAALIQAKQAAEQATQIKAEFLENISHELKTPLHAINGFVELLSMDAEDLSEDQQEYLSEIISASHRLSSLVEGVLEFEHATSNELEISYEDVDIIQLLENSIRDIECLSKDKNITITNNFDHFNNEPFSTDKKHLEKIIHIILNNAVMFNRKNGDIYVTMDILPDEKFKIAVKDTGIGIPKSKESQLFSPFSRINTNADTLGAGINLAVCKQLVESLGGKLKFESTENKGSTFWMEIPLAA